MQLPPASLISLLLLQALPALTAPVTIIETLEKRFAGRHGNLVGHKSILPRSGDPPKNKYECCNQTPQGCRR
jgi:hypothetical protein